jgi:hypothetical protein
VKRSLIFIAASLFLTCLWQSNALGAVGCDLNDPDRDVARLFPGSSGFKTHYVSLDKKGGEALLREVEARLGDRFQGLYETIDVPYTVYEIFKDRERLGYIHGVNQKGQYGGIQVFLVLDVEGNIKNLYLQKMTSRHAAKLREPGFGEQFRGMNLKDFYGYDVVLFKPVLPGKVEGIQNPVPEEEPDFKAILRAAKKNLVLMDEFVYENRYLKYLKAK